MATTSGTTPRQTFSERTRAPRVLALAAGVALMASMSQALRAQDAPATTSPSEPMGGEVRIGTSKPATTQISLNFKDASIDAVLDYLSDVAGFVVVKEAPVSGRITMLSKQPVSPQEAVTLLNTVLKNSGYTAIQMDRVLKIVSRDKAKKSNIPVHFGSDPTSIANTDELITQVVPLRSVDAVKLKQDILPLVGTDADLASNAASNALIITDTSANIRRVVEIVANLDKRDATENTIKVRQLKYADATATAKLVTDIFQAEQQAQGQQNNNNNNPFARFGGGGFPNFGGGGGGGRGGQGGGRGGQGGNGQSAEEAGKTGKVVASADARTNTVVVTGPADTLTTIDKMLDQLDANPASEEAFFIYPLRNGQAANMASVLNGLFGNSGSNSTNRNGSTNNNRGSNTSSNRNAFGGGGSGGSSGGRGGSSGGGIGGSTAFGGAAINRSNGNGNNNNNSRNGNNSNTVSSELTGQVYVVSDDDTNSLLVSTASKYESQVRGIIKELDRPVPQVLIKVLIAEVTHDNSEDLGVDFSVLNLRASGNGQQAGTSFPPNPTGGLVVSVLETNLTATLRALAVQGRLDVLSRPYILASDNQEATITVGQEVPIITDSRLDINNNPVNQITYQNIGIILDVTPHINPDGLVICDVSPQVSSISDTQVAISSTVSATAFNIRSADSRVGIRNGETIVIGGLMDDRKTQTISKVPLLGDIPGLGLLFRRNQTTKTKTELLFFLTPHVAAAPDRLNGMSQDEMNGLKLTPNAVEPGTFQEHMRGLQRGGPSSQPVEPSGPPQPADQDPVPRPKS